MPLFWWHWLHSLRACYKKFTRIRLLKNATATHIASRELEKVKNQTFSVPSMKPREDPQSDILEEACQIPRGIEDTVITTEGK